MTQPERITVEASVAGPVEATWTAYTEPAHIQEWNFASPDWHCPSASVDLREGGAFKSRMEARDGSMGFDFAGTYTSIVPNQQLAYRFGDRSAEVTFVPDGERTRVRVSFDPETEHSLEQQREGWQSIIDSFAAYASRLGSAGQAS